MVTGTGNPADRDKGYEVVLWSVAAGKPVAALAGHKGTVRAVTFSGDGSLLASAGSDGTIRLWEINSQNKPER
jgi:WD40 repeat protein